MTEQRNRSVLNQGLFAIGASLAFGAPALAHDGHGSESLATGPVHTMLHAVEAAGPAILVLTALLAGIMLWRRRDR